MKGISHPIVRLIRPRVVLALLCLLLGGACATRAPVGTDPTEKVEKRDDRPVASRHHITRGILESARHGGGRRNH